MSIHKTSEISWWKDQLVAARYFWQHSQELRDLKFSPADRKSLWKIARYTQVPLTGLQAVMNCVETINRENVPGAIVECGVWRGGCAALLSRGAKAKNRPLWLFDSFQGMPERTEKDDDEHSEMLSKGRASGKLEAVGTNVATEDWVKYLLFSQFDCPAELVHIEKGWFQDTVPPAKSKIGEIALLRLDGDFYESVKICLEELYPQVAPGGIVILDDYHAFIGCKKAFEEYFASTGLPRFTVIQGNHGIWFRKAK